MLALRSAARTPKAIRPLCLPGAEAYALVRIMPPPTVSTSPTARTTARFRGIGTSQNSSAGRRRVDHAAAAQHTDAGRESFRSTFEGAARGHVARDASLGPVAVPVA